MIPTATTGDWLRFRHDSQLSGHQPLAGNIQHPSVIARYPLGGPVFHAESFLLDGQPLLLMLWGGVLHCLRLDGSIRWKSIPMGFEGVIGVDDLDNDGRLEVVLTNGRTIAVVAADSGAVLWQEYLGPPYSAGVMPTGALIHHFPQLGSGKQLAVGLLSSKEVILYDFTPGASNPRRLHTLWMDDFFHPTLLACDVDGDGADELIVTKYAAIYTFDPLSGALKSACHWSSGGTPKRNYGLFVARDLCGAGRLDFAVLSNRVSKHLAVVANNGRGQLSIGWDRFIEHIYPTDSRELRYTFNSCTDVDGDQRMEVIISTFNELGDGAWHLEILDARSGAVRLDCKGLMLHGVQQDSCGGWMILASHQTERQPREFATIGAYRYDGTKLHRLWEVADGAFAGRFCGHDSTTSVFRSELPPEDEVWAVPVDGVLTIPILGRDGVLRLFQQGRDGDNWSWHPTFAAGNVAALLLCSDLDRDERTEFLVSCWDGTCRILRADGTTVSSWRTGLRLRPGTGPYYLARPMQTPTVAGQNQQRFCAVPDGGNNIHLLQWSPEFGGLILDKILVGRGRVGPEETFHSADFITLDGRLTLPLSLVGEGRSVLELHDVGGGNHPGQRRIGCDTFPASPAQPSGRIGLSEFTHVDVDGRSFWLLAGYASASMNSERMVAIDATDPANAHQTWARQLIGEGEEGRGFGPWNAMSVVKEKDGRASLLFLAKDTVCHVDPATGQFIHPPWQLRPFNTADMRRRGLTMDDFAAYGALIPCDVDRDGAEEYLVAGAYGGGGVINPDHTMRWWITAPLSSLCGSLPGIADVDGDSFPELGLSYANGDFVCLRASDGLEKWRVHLGSQATGVATCDIDGNGMPEFLLSTQAGELLAIGVASNGVGIVKWRLKLGYTLGQPIAADINGDGKSEVILVSGEGEILVVGG
ncbi:MAG: VCBS repeat-containing protein [Armatimonadetes bacterium]|nr:VCBS repeat-containing protein [Armatimonadota bacterium]